MIAMLAQCHSVANTPQKGAAMAPGKKPVDDLMDQRVVVMMSKAELEMIDDWSFANRIRSRGEAIRRLVTAGMVKNLKDMEDTRGSRFAHEGGDE
jgi:hypothetical protein